MSLDAEYIEERCCPEPNTGCWLWVRCGNEAGYGHASANGRRIKAHRLSWLVFRGPIPPGMWVLHRCDTPACVNPGHLFLGTTADNSRDMAAKGRQGLHVDPTRAARGSQHGLARLTEDQVREARLLAVSGQGFCSLARRYGVSETTMAKVVKGITWRHVA